MKSLSFVLISVVLLACCSRKELNNKSNENRINLEPIDSLISSYILRNKIPGAVTLIAINGKILYNKAYGYNNKGAGIKQENDDIVTVQTRL